MPSGRSIDGAAPRMRGCRRERAAPAACAGVVAPGAAAALSLPPQALNSLQEPPVAGPSRPDTRAAYQTQRARRRAYEQAPRPSGHVPCLLRRPPAALFSKGRPRPAAPPQPRAAVGAPHIRRKPLGRRPPPARAPRRERAGGGHAGAALASALYRPQPPPPQAARQKQDENGDKVRRELNGSSVLRREY
jgi:hypothetical protein